VPSPIEEPLEHPVRKILPTKTTSAAKGSGLPMCVSCTQRPAVVILVGRGYCGACAISRFEPPYQWERPRRRLTLNDLLNPRR
jgi:hypothetical protein